MEHIIKKLGLNIEHFETTKKGIFKERIKHKNPTYKIKNNDELQRLLNELLIAFPNDTVLKYRLRYGSLTQNFKIKSFKKYAKRFIFNEEEESEFEVYLYGCQMGIKVAELVNYGDKMTLEFENNLHEMDGELFCFVFKF